MSSTNLQELIRLHQEAQKAYVEATSRYQASLQSLQGEVTQHLEKVLADLPSGISAIIAMDYSAQKFTISELWEEGKRVWYWSKEQGWFEHLGDGRPNIHTIRPGFEGSFWSEEAVTKLQEDLSVPGLSTDIAETQVLHALDTIQDVDDTLFILGKGATLEVEGWTLFWNEGWMYDDFLVVRSPEGPIHVFYNMRGRTRMDGLTIHVEPGDEKGLDLFVRYARDHQAKDRVTFKLAAKIRESWMGLK